MPRTETLVLRAVLLRTTHRCRVDPGVEERRVVGVGAAVDRRVADPVVCPQGVDPGEPEQAVGAEAAGERVVEVV